MKIPKKLIQGILSAFCLLSIIATIFLYIQYAHQKKEALNTIQNEAQQETVAAAQKIGQFIAMLVPLVNQLVQELNGQQLSNQKIIEFLRKKPTEISGFGISFCPESLDSLDKRRTFYYVEKNGTQELIQLEHQFDYTKPEHQWYHKTLSNGSQYLEDKLWTLSEHILIGFAAPFYKKNSSNKKIPAGVVFAHHTAEHIKHILTTIYLGKTGYCFILSDDCTVLVHPYDKHAQEQNKLNDIINNQKSDLHDLIDRLKNRKSNIMQYYNEIDGKLSWLFIEPIPNTSWNLCRVLPHDEIPLNRNMLRQTIMLLSLSFLIFLICSLLLVISFVQLTEVRLWLTSFVVSALMFLELSAFWYIIWHMPPYHEDLIPIRDKVGLYAFLDTIGKEHTIHNKQYLHKQTTEKMGTIGQMIRNEQQLSKTIHQVLQYRYKQHGYIPTGIYIQHLKLATENQIEMTAYIWQRYFDKIHDSVSRGFVLPQAAVTKCNEVYHTKEDYTETIIWQVRATINQQTLYIKYPFDIKDVHIQIAHKDFNQNIVLVPDFASYKLIHPTALPGLSKDICLPGWHIVNSYFGYKLTDYDTAFGLYSYGPLGVYKEVEKCNQPELYYNITAQRYLINTLIADLLPLAIIALLLFVILLSSELQGYGVLGSCATVFFGALIAQVRFRGRIESYNLIYFETFYLVMYTAIIAIVIITLLYMLKIRIPIIHYKKNIITKLLYWPTILAALLIITFKYFY